MDQWLWDERKPPRTSLWQPNNQNFRYQTKKHTDPTQHKGIAGKQTVIQTVSQWEGVDGQISITALISLCLCSV